MTTRSIVPSADPVFAYAANPNDTVNFATLPTSGLERPPLVQQAVPIGIEINFPEKWRHQQTSELWADEKGAQFASGRAVQDYVPIKQRNRVEPQFLRPKGARCTMTAATVLREHRVVRFFMPPYTLPFDAWLRMMPGAKEKLDDLVSLLCVLGLDSFLKLHDRWLWYRPQGVYDESKPPYLFMLFVRDYAVQQNGAHAEFEFDDWVRHLSGRSDAKLQAELEEELAFKFMQRLNLPQFISLFVRNCWEELKNQYDRAQLSTASLRCLHSWFRGHLDATDRRIFCDKVNEVIRNNYGNNMRLTLFALRARLMKWHNVRYCLCFLYCDLCLMCFTVCVRTCLSITMPTGLEPLVGRTLVPRQPFVWGACSNLTPYSTSPCCDIYSTAL